MTRTEIIKELEARKRRHDKLMLECAKSDLFEPCWHAFLVNCERMRCLRSELRRIEGAA